MSIPIILAFIILGTIFKNTIYPVIKVSFLITGNIFTAILLAFAAIFLTLIALGIVGDILSIESFAGTMIKKTPFPRFIKTVRLVQKIKRGGHEFPEVRIAIYGKGYYKRGIAVSKIFAADINKTEYIVVEPRPMTFGWPVHYVEEENLHLTGRTGWDLIKSTVPYAFLLEDHENDKGPD